MQKLSVVGCYICTRVNGLTYCRINRTSTITMRISSECGIRVYEIRCGRRAERLACVRRTTPSLPRTRAQRSRRARLPLLAGTRRPLASPARSLHIANEHEQAKCNEELLHESNTCGHPVYTTVLWLYLFSYTVFTFHEENSMRETTEVL